MSQTAASEAGKLFREGRLADAVTAANGMLRKSPTDLGARILLAELLVFSGNLERADVVLDACSDLDPTLAVVVAEFRQLVRGEIARRQLFRDGRVPEFLGEPTASQRHALAALVAARAGDMVEAGRMAAQAEIDRVHPTGIADGAPFDDLRDGDDLLASSLEVITTTGKYFWIPPERVSMIEFHPPKRPRDLYWRRASVEVESGPDGEVYIPAVYPSDAVDPALTDALRLGRETDWWQATENAPTRGRGAVTLLVGDGSATLLEMRQLSFQTAK